MTKKAETVTSEHRQQMTRRRLSVSASKADVADLMGVHRTTVHRLETGDNRCPGAPTLRAWVDAIELLERLQAKSEQLKSDVIDAMSATRETDDMVPDGLPVGIDDDAVTR